MSYTLQLKPGEASTFHRQWEGPYEIVTRVTDVRYGVKKVRVHSRRSTVVHFNILRLYQRRKEGRLEQTTTEEKEEVGRETSAWKKNMWDQHCRKQERYSLRRLVRKPRQNLFGLTMKVYSLIEMRMYLNKLGVSPALVMSPRPVGLKGIMKMIRWLVRRQLLERNNQVGMRGMIKAIWG